MENQAEIAEIVEAVAREAGFELVDLQVHRNRITVFIDKPGGVNIGECADFSREIRVLIDVERIMNSPCEIEVSSPGTERPLRKPKDYRRFAGRRARLKTRNPFDGRSVFTGRIDGMEDGCVQMSAEDSGVFSIPFDSIEKANLKREL